MFEADAVRQRLPLGEEKGSLISPLVVSGGRGVCFFDGPDGVQLEFIEMKA